MIDTAHITLSKGQHTSPEDGMCVMELAAYIAGEPHTDHPVCVSPVIASFLRSWNDKLNDTDRQMLRPYADKVLHTADQHDEQRAWLAADWLIREHLPTWLDFAGLSQHAASLRDLETIDCVTRLPQANVTVSIARDASRDASRDAEPAMCATWAAGGAGIAAWSAAWGAARNTAWAAGDAAGASRDAFDAARAAASVAASAAAWAAARQNLAPTVSLLQQSALGLLDRMIAVGKEQK